MARRRLGDTGGRNQFQRNVKDPEEWLIDQRWGRGGEAFRMISGGTNKTRKIIPLTVRIKTGNTRAHRIIFSFYKCSLAKEIITPRSRDYFFTDRALVRKVSPCPSPRGKSQTTIQVWSGIPSCSSLYPVPNWLTVAFQNI